MIPIKRTPKPAQLTEEVQEQLTEKFKIDKSQRVWNKDYLKTALLEMSHNKCCYCERKIGKGELEMHIDHFRPKSIFPEDVVNWDNLLPSCADCNREKGDHNTEIEPIINPCRDDPREYFYLNNYMYMPLSTGTDNNIAKLTIVLLDLNDMEEHCVKRYRIGAGLIQKLDTIMGDAKKNLDDILQNTVRKKKLVRSCRDILRLCTPDAEYSAFNATTLHNDHNYIALKELLVENNLWNPELEELDSKSQSVVYRVKNK